MVTAIELSLQMSAFYTPILGIDIDNVLSATDSMIRRLIHNFYGVNAPQKQIRYWHYSDSLPISTQQEKFVFDQFHRHYCQAVDLIDGARNALSRLRSFGKVWLITQRPESARTGTVLWLRRHNLEYDRLIFAQDKMMYASSLWMLVEDNGDTALAAVEKGVERVFLLDYPWNQHVTFHPHICRVRCWREILNVVFEQLPINEHLVPTV